MGAKPAVFRFTFLVFLLFGATAAQANCRYDVRPEVADGLRDLSLAVSIDCDAALRQDDFAFSYGASGHVDWAADGALAYNIRLGDFAAGRGGQDFAATGRGVLAPLAAWLAAPHALGHAADLLVAYRPTAGVRLLDNLTTRDGRRLLKRADWRFGGYTVFSDRPPLQASAPGPASFAEPGRPGPETSEIRIAVLGDDLAMTDRDVVDWIERFSGLTARFWAGFPSDRLLIAVTPGGRLGDPFGRVRGGGGATMLLRLSERENPNFLHTRDWVLTHELIHLGAPFAPRRQPWFMEGMATYLEPVIRALGGATPKEMVWTEWLRAMPTGAMGVNMSGLEGRGHPYWTGALFFLLAHTELARRGVVEGLAPCFRAIRRELGDAARRSTVDRLIAVCDREIGFPLLAELERRHATPSELDLPALWAELGVRRKGGGVVFSETGATLRRTLFDLAQFPSQAP